MSLSSLPDAYVVSGQAIGTLSGFGTAARMFTGSFDASPETGRILGVLASLAPFQSPRRSPLLQQHQARIYPDIQCQA